MSERSSRWSVWGVVAAVIVGVGPISGASVHAVAATPSPGAMVFQMEPAGSRAKICTGDSAQYSVAVKAYFGSDSTFVFPGFKVEAFPGDKALGSFAKSTVTTRRFAGEPAIATFTFKAGSKPGKTILFFQGRFPNLGAIEGYVSANIPISVVECQFQISGALRFPADKSGGVPLPAIVVALRPTKLQADPQGHISGSASVHWFSGSASVKLEGGTCTGTLKFGKADQVVIEGDVNENEVVPLTFKFPPALGSWSGQCDGLSVPMGTSQYSIKQLTVYFRVYRDGGATVDATISSSATTGSASFYFKKLKSGS